MVFSGIKDSGSVRFATGEPFMCDYSIRHVASRPAKVGDKLVTTSFDNPENRGFAAVGQPDVAVCLLPGTQLALARVVEYDHVLARLFPSLRSRKSRGH